MISVIFQISRGFLEVNKNFLNICFNYYHNFLKIFTDGSKQETEDVGSASYIEVLKTTLIWKLSFEHSVIATELFDILNSLIWI